ncbi:hypothetical protein [Streptomyces sp. SLBN-8D4]
MSVASAPADVEQLVSRLFAPASSPAPKPATVVVGGAGFQWSRA